MRVDVIVVSHRSRAHLEACLAALPGAAAGADYGLRVVDNASDDGSAAWLEQQIEPACLVLNVENRGFAAAVNQGVAGSRAEAVLLLNPDAVLEPGALRILVDELVRDPAAGVVGPQLLYPDGTPQPSAWLAPGAGTLAFEALMLHNLFPRARLQVWAPVGQASEDVPCLPGTSLLVRRACWDRTGGFDERFFLYYEDVDFCLRARQAGYRVKLVPAARVRHERGGSAFQDRGQFVRRFHESRRRFLRKHHAGWRGTALVGLDALGLALRSAAHEVRGRLTGRRDFVRSAAHYRAALRAWWSGGDV